jgi:hypothetical protein
LKTANSIQAVAIVLFAVFASTLVRKGRTDPNIPSLQPRQRIRPITLEWLDPVLAIIVVGPLLGHELRLSVWHVVAAVLGASIGIPIGWLRSRVQFVRAIASTKSVVLTRSNAEYALVVLLVVLRSAQDFLSKSHSALITIVFAALLALPIGESVARSVSITNKYHASLGELPAADSSA